jgi:hypothetical protein
VSLDQETGLPVYYSGHFEETYPNDPRATHSPHGRPPCVKWLRPIVNIPLCGADCSNTYHSKEAKHGD